MTGVVAGREEIEPGVVRGQWWHPLADGRTQCDVCPRACKLHEGERGFCYVREARDGGVVLTSYGRATGYCIDPIEKKPLHHFYPSSSVLSFGTVGCNLGCRFCQNWDIAKAHQDRRHAAKASPLRVAEAALEGGCTSIALTYNDPAIFAEYAIDCAQEAHDLGVRTVAVSAGFMTPELRRDFFPVGFPHFDAANIDLKAFSERFYHDVCSGQLQPVLDTLEWIKHETETWLEVTTLLIPGYNDSEREVEALCEWLAEHLGPEVPLHFTAFHPDYKLLNVPPPPAATLQRARKQGKAAGLHHVYTGNIRDPEGQTTYCASCKNPVIGRDGYVITAWNLDADGHCNSCGDRLVGHFAPTPEQWGMKRELVFLGGQPIP